MMVGLYGSRLLHSLEREEANNSPVAEGWGRPRAQSWLQVAPRHQSRPRPGQQLVCDVAAPATCSCWVRKHIHHFIKLRESERARAWPRKWDSSGENCGFFPGCKVWGEQERGPVSGVAPSGDNLYTGTTRWADKNWGAGGSCSDYLQPVLQPRCHPRIRFSSRPRVMRDGEIMTCRFLSLLRRM